MMVNVEYINNAGYVVETEKAVYIFDYVEGLLPSRYLYSEKETFFFVTSRHRNHYNESIYSYGKTVILSSDILVSPYRNVFMMEPGDEIHLGFAKVRTYESTGGGVCYFIQEGDLKILHAGSLNNWHWKDTFTPAESRFETHRFHEILQEIAVYAPIDILMFTLEPSMGEDFDCGAREALDLLQPLCFFPIKTKHDDSRFFNWAMSRPITTCYEPKHDNQVFRNII